MVPWWSSAPPVATNRTADGRGRRDVDVILPHLHHRGWLPCYRDRPASHRRCWEVAMTGMSCGGRTVLSVSHRAKRPAEHGTTRRPSSEVVRWRQLLGQRAPLREGGKEEPNNLTTARPHSALFWQDLWVDDDPSELRDQLIPGWHGSSRTFDSSRSRPSAPRRGATGAARLPTSRRR